MTNPPAVDLVLRNGRIWTGCEDLAERPHEVSSLAVRDDRILAAGSDDELAPLAADAAQVLDLRGRRMLPGLIDSHTHALRAGLSWAVSLHWEQMRSLADCLTAVREQTMRTPAGSWITVLGGWHADQLREGRPPTRAELDAVAPDHPVFVQELYERGTVNSAGLRACGWDDSSEDPDRGVLVRDRAGRLTGEIRGVGTFAVPTTAALRVSHDDAVSGTREMVRAFAAEGLTGVADGFGMLLTPQDLRPLFDVWRSGDLDLRVRLFLSPWSRGDEVANVQNLTQIAQPGFGDDMLRTSGIGEIAHLGCHDLEGLTPFEITDGAYAELVEIVRTCVAAGWRMSVHAVLNETLSRILDAWEQVEAEIGGVRGRRFSIVHADQATPQNLDRIAALGAGIMVQNRTMLSARRYLEPWGEDAVRRMPPIGDMLSRGVRIGAGTDATRANWYSPWASIWWLVTGESVSPATVRDPQHRLSITQAIAAYTRDAAWFTDEESTRGRLAAGFAADLCVPTLDPFSCEPDRLRDISSDLTLLGGRVTHSSGEFASLSS